MEEKTTNLPNGGKKLQVYQMEEITTNLPNKGNNYKSTKWTKKTKNIQLGHIQILKNLYTH